MLKSWVNTLAIWTAALSLFLIGILTLMLAGNAAWKSLISGSLGGFLYLIPFIIVGVHRVILNDKELTFGSYLKKEPILISLFFCTGYFGIACIASLAAWAIYSAVLNLRNGDIIVFISVVSIIWFSIKQCGAYLKNK